MNHLTDDQLSAFSDGALTERERSACEAHLAACEPCRTRLAEQSALEESLSRALEHDPGEAYFESFAERVAARITQGSPASAATGTQPRGTAPSATRGSAWAWLFTPRGLSLAGSVAAVIAVAGIVLIQRDSFQGMASRRSLESRGRAVREVAPPPNADAFGQPQAQAPPSGSKEQSATEQDRAPGTPRDADVPASRASESARAREVKRDGQGEDVPVRAEAAPQAAGARAPVSGATPATPFAEMKRRSASPAAPAPVPSEPAAKPADQASGGAPFVQETEESQARSGAAKSEPAPTRAQSEQAAKNLAASQRLAAPAPAPSAAKSQKLDELHTSTQGITPPSLAAVKDGASPCGTVHDTRGAPISGARVTVANDPARSARSGADGRFCLPRLATGDTLSILRVGFAPQRIVVEPATSLAVRLEAIGTLGPESGMKLGRPGSSALAPPSGAPPPSAFLFRDVTPNADPYAGQSSAVQRAVSDARSAGELATRERTAGAHERAADRWEQVVKTATGAAALDARYRALASLREAQRLEPTPARAERLRAGLDVFVATAPRANAQRDTVLRWQGELGKKGELGRPKSTYR